MMSYFRLASNSALSQKYTVYRSYPDEQFGIYIFLLAEAIYHKNISFAGFDIGYE